MITYAVVTKAEVGRGNLALAMPLFLDPQAKGGSYSDDPIPLREALGNPMIEMYIQTQVFHVGEVLILGPDGREYGYPGRKPSKWSIEIEKFETLDAAITRAHEVME